MQAAPSRLVWLEQGFSASALWTFWLILCHVWLFYGLQDIQQHLRPLSSRYQRQFPLSPLTVTIEDAPRYCQMISPCQFRPTARVFPVKREKKKYGDIKQDAARGKSRGKRSKDMCVMAKVDMLNLSSVGKSLRDWNRAGPWTQPCVLGKLLGSSGSQRVRHVCKENRLFQPYMQEDMRAGTEAMGRRSGRADESFLGC